MYLAGEDAAERNYLAALLTCETADATDTPFEGFDFSRWQQQVDCNTFQNIEYKAIYWAACLAYTNSSGQHAIDWEVEIPKIQLLYKDHELIKHLNLATLVDLLEDPKGYQSNIAPSTRELKRYANRRKLINLYGDIYEAAANGEDPTEIYGRLQTQMMIMENAVEGEQPTAIDLDSIDEATPDEGKCLLDVGGVGIFKTKNLHAVTAVAGQGKTQFLKLISGAFLNPQGVGYIRPTAAGQKVLYIDTEQELSDIKSFCRAVRTLAPETFSKHTFEMHSMINHDTRARRARYVNLVKRSNADLVIIDGVTDFMQNTNDIEETTSLRDELKILANQCNCAIVLVIHQNESSENDKASKMRGAVGSELARKVSNSFYVSNIMQDGVKVFKVENKKARNAETTDIYFQLEIVGTDAIPRLVNLADLTHDKQTAKVKPYFDWLKEQNLQPTYGNLKKALIALEGYAEGYAKNVITKFKNGGTINADAEGVYYIV